MTFEELTTKHGLHLTPQQEAAVHAVNGPVLLLAVPGSGKTTVLVTRLGYMVLHCGIDPRSILTMTYTVAATQDMRQRCAQLFGEDLANALEFRTINGVSARIIRRCEQLVGQQAFELVSEERRLNEMIGQICRAVTEDYVSEAEIKSIRTAITYVKNRMLKEDEITAMEKEIPHFGRIYKTYNTALRSQGLMDYDDQMVYAWRILKKYPRILQEFQQRYPYICVDEAQDTSLIQHRIIDLLASGTGNLFMVGDEDQSIYGFRAAYPQALMEFEQNHPGALVLMMTHNFRSTPQIIDAADRFIANNRSRRPKHMVAARSTGAQLREIPMFDRRGQYKYLAAVAENCTRETAVLYRDNDCALPLIDLLVRRGLPYRCRQPDGIFFTHRVVRDIADIIHLAADPSNTELFLRVYYKLGAGISKAAAQRAVQRSNARSDLLDLVSRDESLSPHSRRICRELSGHMSELLSEPAHKAIKRIVWRMGYGEYTREHGGDMNKLAILEALGEQEPTPMRLLERLNELRAIVLSHIPDPNCPFILSTIHSAKGLEYDRVFLMDVFDGMLPKPADEEADAQARTAATEEERRLFYVGMTRAKNDLAVFTFEKKELRSSFSGLLFPKAETEPEPEPDRKSDKPRRPRALPQATIASSPLSGRAVQTDIELTPGTAVRHTNYGGGVIRERSGDILTIEFDSGRTQMFSAKAALKARVLDVEI